MGSVVYPLPPSAKRLVGLSDGTDDDTEKEERRPFGAAFLNLF